MLDIYSRYVVGWMVATVESGDLAQRFIAESLEKQGIMPSSLTIHADRGTSMKSKPVTQLMADLGVTKSHSRPKVSDDNPFSEAQFKTLKYLVVSWSHSAMLPRFNTRYPSAWRG
jgi:putative transposase